MTTSKIKLFNDIMQNPNRYSDITLTNGSILCATINGCEGDDANVRMVLDEQRTAQAEAADFVK